MLLKTNSATNSGASQGAVRGAERNCSSCLVFFFWKEKTLESSCLSAAQREILLLLKLKLNFPRCCYSVFGFISFSFFMAKGREETQRYTHLHIAIQVCMCSGLQPKNSTATEPQEIFVKMYIVVLLRSYPAPCKTIYPVNF